MCIVGARQVVSSGVFVDLSLAGGKATVKWGSQDSEIPSTHTASLPEPSLFRLLAAHLAHRCTGTGYSVLIRRRIVVRG